MKLYTSDTVLDVVSKPTKKWRGAVYDDNIYSFDIETTSLFIKDGKQLLFDKTKSPEFYKPAEKIGFMYIWQFSINDQVYYGRTWEMFLDMLRKLGDAVTGVPIVYIHNLGYEFQFLRNVIPDMDVFARKDRHPITAKSLEYSVEFRCSLMLTNNKLANIPDMYNLPVKKMVGDLDYNVIRTSETKLTDKELGYCEHDCLVVYYLIEQLREQYKHVWRIPLTQTGMLRKRMQQIYRKNDNYHKWVKGQLASDIDDLFFCLDAYSGGYTHANSYHANKIIKNVHSMDIASSYPTVMIEEQFPISKFYPSSITALTNMRTDRCYLIDITFYGLMSKTDNTYLSFSKAQEKYHAIVDNGRIAAAEMIRYTLTDVDIDIIKQSYKWDHYTINKAMAAEKGYLDSNFIKEVLALYTNKTQLKGLDFKHNEYVQSKQFINSMYGMMVTNNITDDVSYSDYTGWTTKPMDHESAQEKLDQINNDRRTFLNQSWGVWVTAYARHNLWEMILKIDNDVIYCDTDSIKYIGNHAAMFDEFNQRKIDHLIKCVCHRLDLPDDAIMPVDTKGNKHPIGVYEHDDDYDQFITLGAKKYAYIEKESSKIGITLSGVNKKSGASALKKLSDFSSGFTFDYEHTGKQMLTYNDDQPEIMITDCQKHKTLVSQRYGINIMPVQYTIGMTDEYWEYINSTVHSTYGGFNDEAELLQIIKNFKG